MSPANLEPPPDDEGPSLVRPYALVRGRTRTPDGPVMAVEAIVETTGDGASTHLPLEQGAIVARCAEPCSVAELAVHLRVPVGVTRVLVADLVRLGAVQVHLPASARNADGTVDRALLERVLAGLEAL